MKGMTRIAIVLSASLWAAACATTDPCMTIMEERPLKSGIEMNSVHIVDSSLESHRIMATYCEGVRLGPTAQEQVESGQAADIKTYKVTVEEYNSRFSPTGTREVWAILRNHTNYPLRVEGRTHFFDSHKAPSEAASAWQRVELPPKGLGTYREFSKGARGVDYYHIEVREQR
jgi:hypothetical protein